MRLREQIDREWYGDSYIVAGRMIRGVLTPMIIEAYDEDDHKRNMYLWGVRAYIVNNFRNIRFTQEKK